MAHCLLRLSTDFCPPGAASDGEPWSKLPVQHRKDVLAAPADSARCQSGPRVTETVTAIVAAHRAGTASPAQTVARSFARIRDHDDPAIFISLRDEKEAIAEPEALSAKDAAQLPLFGVPVAVKDNIDVAGLPTTAGCPAFSYVPSRDATCVARLRAAGAILIGKTNLDQFATGLVGVRSPYGIPKNPMRGDLIPGGSRSGSAGAGAGRPGAAGLRPRYPRPGGGAPRRHPNSWQESQRPGGRTRSRG